MIVYYDVLSDREVGSDSYEQTTPSKGVIAIQSKRITIQEGDIDVGGNPSAGGGEGDAEDEGHDAPESRSVINVVEAGKLTQINLDKKEYQTMLKTYWKKLLGGLNKLRWKALEFDEDYTPPEDKKEAEAKEEAAAAKLSTFDRKPYEEAKAKLASFKANFESLQKFIKDEILANFDECEFYLPEETSLGDGMLIAARYIGESPAPIFYIFQDGIREKKE